MRNGICGIYRIKNTANGKFYIGSSVNIEYRYYMHLFLLRHNRHCNNYLQNAFIKYGEDAFVLDIMRACAKEDLIKLEQYYMDILHPEYNLLPFAGRSTGYIRSEEYRAKLSMAAKGNKNLLGYHHTEEARRKIAEASKGNKNLLGYHFSEESKQKISIANKGMPVSPETCKRLSIAIKESWRKRKEQSNVE
jgi:group I intron endonuclease